METQSIHPAVKKHIIGKAPVGVPSGVNSVSVEENGSTSSDMKSKQSDVPQKSALKQDTTQALSQVCHAIILKCHCGKASAFLNFTRFTRGIVIILSMWPTNVVHLW